VLSNPKLVAPKAIGLPWLLAMARQADETLHAFAHRYLLENFTPEEFEGIDRLWALATGKHEPEAVRRFAATYLKVHHPDLASMKAQGIAPKLTREAYGLARVRALFLDERQDVRELAGAIGQKELVRWGDSALLYQLADSPHKEPKRLASELLLSIGEPDPEK